MANVKTGVVRQINRSERPDLERAVDDYQDDLAARNRTPATIAAYGSALRCFLWYAGAESWPDLQAITTTHIRAYVRYLQTAPVRFGGQKPASRKPLQSGGVHSHYRVLRAFCYWAEQQGIIERSPMARMKAPSREQRVIPVFTADHVNHMVEVCQRDHRNGLRNLAIVLVLLDTGMRAAELCGLRLKDVQQGRARVMGKGRKERYVSLGKRAGRALKNYIERERPDVDMEQVFVTERGELVQTCRLTHLIQQLGKQADVEGVRCSPHTFRHTFALECLRSGKWTIYELQRQLGHSPRSLSVLQGYLSALNDDDVARAHEGFSPADGMKLKLR